MTRISVPEGRRRFAAAPEHIALTVEDLLCAPKSNYISGLTLLCSGGATRI